MSSDATTKANKRGTSLFQKIKKVGKVIYRVLKSHAGLIILLVIYTVIGGAIFSAIEGPFEKSEAIAMNTTREKFLVDMRKALGQRNWSEETRDLLDDFEDKMKYYFSHARDIEDGKVKPVWTFIGALVYSMTVYTTIGYGHIAPVTDEGKAATVIYAIIGIPLCLLVMADLGRLMTKGIKGLFALLKRFYYTGQLSRMRKTKAMEFLEKKLDMKSQGDLNTSTDEQAEAEAEAEGKTLLYGYEIDDEFNLPVSVALAIVGIYLFCCAAIYTRFENWSYGEALYFLFVSMSTIGFGDIVPENQKFFLASSLLVLFGLSLVSMTITVLVDYIADLYMKAKDKIHAKVTAIGDKIGIDVSALDKLMTKNDDDDNNGKKEKGKEDEDQQADVGEVGSKSEPEAETKNNEAKETGAEPEETEAEPGETEDGEEEKVSTPTDGKSKIPQRKKDD